MSWPHCGGISCAPRAPSLLVPPDHADPLRTEFSKSETAEAFPSQTFLSTGGLPSAPPDSATTGDGKNGPVCPTEFLLFSGIEGHVTVSEVETGCPVFECHVKVSGLAH